MQTGSFPGLRFLSLNSEEKHATSVLWQSESAELFVSARLQQSIKEFFPGSLQFPCMNWKGWIWSRLLTGPSLSRPAMWWVCEMSFLWFSGSLWPGNWILCFLENLHQAWGRQNFPFFWWYLPCSWLKIKSEGRSGISFYLWSST